MHAPKASDMPEAKRDEPPRVTPEIASEAAVWVARLHGPDRSRAMELECLDWQARSAAHRLAFERCTDTWQAVSAVTVSTYAGAAARSKQTERRPAPSHARRAVLASSASAFAALLGWRLWPGEQTYETGIGEQRVVMLADGTRMTLNTSTDVRVEMTKAQRTVRVLQGEALFEVAKEPGRPFVVQVSGAQVVATGTAFLVRAAPSDRSGDDAFGITLIEGQVIVQRTGKEAPATPIVMKPGERLQVARSASSGARRDASPTHLDRPQIDKLVAWQRGEAVFDDTPLRDAVAEMNRYSKVRIAVVGDTVGALRISGLHRTGDNESFARSVAQLHGLRLRSDAGRLELAAQ